MRYVYFTSISNVSCCNTYIIGGFDFSAYIDDTNKYNVITVDWSEFAKTVNYFKSASRCDKVGIIIGHFLINLYRLDIETPNNMHLIGHSLGAHVAGVGGRTFSEMTNERIARITGPYNTDKTFSKNTRPKSLYSRSMFVLFYFYFFCPAGLDPSRLLFERAWFVCSKFYHRLNSDDADFVDVIYTTEGRLGISTDVGHANFYPNDGKSPQPGCRSLNPNTSCTYTFYLKHICMLICKCFLLERF